MKPLLLLLGTLGAMLVATIWGAARFWRDGPEVDVGIHGWIAMIGGSVLTLLVGVGLMTLVFYSARKGYDDAAAPSEPSDGERR
jgi:hypothetical protein